MCVHRVALNTLSHELEHDLAQLGLRHQNQPKNYRIPRLVKTLLTQSTGMVNAAFSREHSEKRGRCLPPSLRPTWRGMLVKFVDMVSILVEPME